MDSVVHLTVRLSPIQSCFVGVSSVAANKLFGGRPQYSSHWVRVLELRAQCATVYVGYVGGRVYTPEENNILIISKIFAECINIKDGEIVIVQETNINNNYNYMAASLNIKPLTADDFEIISLQSDFAENEILGQIVVVYPSMKFPVWLLNSHLAYFTVMDITPYTHTHTHTH
eukprot:GHVR01124467.1.p1 GENE.GHVR01124467.1~~GHVR01124467.1.p1  ORF type:complete len:173 (+),score=66.22 GHVR01124467.1:62-580(+)